MTAHVSGRKVRNPQCLLNELAEMHTEPVGLPPYDAANARGVKIVETQFKRFRCVRRGRDAKTGAIVRQVVHYAIND